MRHGRWLITGTVIASLQLFALGGATSAAPAFTVLDLGTLGGCTARPTLVNDAGQVVGRVLRAAGHQHAFFVDGDGRDGRSRHARRHMTRGPGVNEAGQVVGYS